MKICFPIRDLNGKEFTSVDEVMSLINSEAHGTWLLGANGLWHGGIHISDITQPFSALNKDAHNDSDPIPLQFMADGTVVAYRVNDVYQTAPYCGKPLRFSTSFVLVKSVCQPDPEKNESWLEFYSLYMHLAAVEDYPKSSCYKVSSGHNGISVRKYIRGNYGVPETESSPQYSAAYNAPEAVAKIVVNEGDRFVVSRTGRFYVTRRRETKLLPFGLSRLLKNGKLSQEQYWITLDAGYVERDGEMYDLMPGWLNEAVAKGTFNSVVNTDGSAVWKVAAGSPVGFMGLNEVPGVGQLVEQERFVHLEVISTDSKMPAFLSNPASVTTGGKLIRTIAGKKMHLRNGETNPPTFTASEVALASGALLNRESTSPVKDAAGKWWFKVSDNGWMPQADVEEIEQYDLLKQGFYPLAEDSDGDIMHTFMEGWVSEAFGQVAEVSKGNNSGPLSARVPEYYRTMMGKLDENKDGKISADEIRRALSRRDPQVRNIIDRLVIKHHSEWIGGPSEERWKGFYKILDKLSIPYCTKWQSGHEWMSKVDAFKDGDPVWHMHPITFLNALKKNKEKLIIFPLKVKPKNDLLNEWKRYYWAASLSDLNASQAIFGRARSGGQRRHAARDLYTAPLTEVVAVCDGIIRNITHYYYGTWQITVEHKTKDGRHFYVRYGEVDPRSIVVRAEQLVKQGDVLAKTGLMINPNTGRHPDIIPGQTVYMLHFEYYPTDNSVFPPNNTPDEPYRRRADLKDPLEILKEGYANTFELAQSSDSRTDINLLDLSDDGKKFIKDWEGFRPNAYNDSEGYCTIGYGHLIARSKCEDIILSAEFRNGIDEGRANELFEVRLPRYISSLKNSVTVNLYQHEFDALVCLLFNLGSLTKAPNLRAKLNSGDYDGASNEFLDITNGGTSGLVSRRNSERNLFLEGVYDSSH